MFKDRAEEYLREIVESHDADYTVINGVLKWERSSGGTSTLLETKDNSRSKVLALKKTIPVVLPD